MTPTLTEYRLDHQNKPYSVQVTIQQSTDATLDSHLTETLREWFHRKGLIDANTLTDEQLLNRLRLTFSTNRRPIT